MIQSLERGIRTLVFLSQKNAGVTEVALELGVDKSTAFRILETLEEHNMVSQDEATAKYRLGPGVLRLSRQLVKNLNIISVAKPFMVKLVEDTGESCHLCMLSNGSAVVIEQIMGSSRLSVNARVGNAEPIYCSSVGKCLLAWCEEDKRERIISRIEFTPYTKNTIADAAALRKELEAVRFRGYAVDDGELSEEVLCAAAPIFNHAGSVLYSLGVSGPRSRLKGKKIEAVAEELTHTASRISEQMGYFRE